MKTLALAFIAKNEKENLIKCKYNEVFHLFDEVVMQDTGSTDGTVEYLQQFDVKILQENWKNDFSYHRNKLLENITADYVFFADPDMEFDEDLIIKIRNIINNYKNEEVLISVTCTNLYDNGEQNRCAKVMVTPNSPKIRYKGKIHENISESIANGNYRIEHITDGKLLHYGYYTSKLMDKKVERNFELLKETYKTDSNPTSYFQYAAACFDTNYEDKGESVFLEIINQNRACAEYSHLYLSYIYIANKNIEKAYYHIKKACENNDYPTAWNYKGFIEMGTNSFEESVKSYNTALKVLKRGNTNYILPLNEKRETIKSYEGLIISLFELKKYRDIALISTKLEKLSEIKSEMILFKLAKSFLEIGQIEQAKLYLSKIKH